MDQIQTKNLQILLNYYFLSFYFFIHQDKIPPNKINIQKNVTKLYQ